MTKALAHSPGRGGRRSNQTGRPPGTASEKKYGTVLEVLASPEMDGLTPIQVMLHNMKYYHDRGADLDEKLEEVATLMTPAQIAAGGDAVLNVLQLIKDIGQFRMKAQECAVDAAPYVHPRLAALAVKIDNGNSKKPPVEITKAMSPQLALEAYRALLADDD